MVLEVVRNTEAVGDVDLTHSPWVWRLLGSKSWRLCQESSIEQEISKWYQNTPLFRIGGGVGNANTQTVETAPGLMTRSKGHPSGVPLTVMGLEPVAHSLVSPYYVLGHGMGFHAIASQRNLLRK